MSDTEQDADAEQAAVSLLRAGSISGLEVLVCLHQARALRAAYAITHNQAAAEDVVAEAFLRAFERIGGFDPKRPFGPWFLRIVVNLSIKEADRSHVLDHLRLRRASVEPEPPVDPAIGPDLDMVVSRQEKQRK
jgi:RNA polymerase sigma factor (sigma-70 family)